MVTFFSMIHFAIKLCAKPVETICCEGWLILIKHSILNISWFTAITQTNYEVFCWKRWENRRRMQGNVIFFPLKLNALKWNDDSFCGISRKALIQLHGSQKELAANWAKLRSHRAKNGGENSVNKIKTNTQNTQNLVMLCWQPQMRQQSVDFWRRHYKFLLSHFVNLLHYMNCFC